MGVDTPRVVYQDSTKQAVIDDWKTFTRDQLAPLPVICDGCNGVVQVESERHLFAKYRALEDTGVLDAVGIDRVVKETVHQLLDISTWKKAVEAEVYELTGGRNYGIYRAENIKYRAIRESQENNPVERVAEAVLDRMNRDAHGTADLYTYCPNCEAYVPLDLPDFMRRDVQEEFKRRVAKEHELDYMWRKPDTILPKADQPKSEPDWGEPKRPEPVAGIQKPEPFMPWWQPALLLAVVFGLFFVAFILPRMLRI